jgi:hypothetical protein
LAWTRFISFFFQDATRLFFFTTDAYPYYIFIIITMTKRARSITPPSDPDQDCAQTAHKRRRVELPIPVPVPRRTRNISVGDLRQILSIFIFDIPWMEQGERAVDEVESILFSGDAPSLSEKERRRAIFVQVHRHLKQFLFLHG